MKSRLFLGFGALLGVLFFAATGWAAEGADLIRPDLGGEVKMWLGIAAGFGMGIASFGGAMGQGKAVAAAVEGIARNPGAKDAVFMPMLIGLALIESLVALTFVITFAGLAAKI